jgi:uncharacterized protein (TIGR03435 family)
MRSVSRLPLLALLCLPAFAQPAPRAEFEVASVKPSPPSAPAQLQIGLHIDGAQVRCTYLSLKDYIRSAYRLGENQISGPDWIASERFDISAKIPEGSTREQVPQMLQALLEDRFQLKSHRETKDFPVYGLTVAKSGLKLQRTPGTEGEDPADARKSGVDVTASGSAAGTTVNFGNGSYFSLRDNKIEGKKLTMAALASTLTRFVDRPIIDMTDQKGYYDFTLPFSPEDFRAMMIRAALNAGVALPPQALQLLEMSNGDSLFTAIQTVGLKLEPRKAPLDVFVIDRIQRTPSDN